MKNYFLLILVSLFFLTGCQVSESESTTINDHLNLDITFNNDILSVKAEYTFYNKYEGSDSAHFVLNPGIQPMNIKSEKLDSQSMALIPNRPFPFRKLKFKEPMKKGQKVIVYFEYDINLSQLNFISEDWIELNVDQLWFPNYDDLNHKFTSTTTINNLYEDYSLISCCGNEIIKNENGSLTMEVKEPVPSVFIVGGKNMKYWNDDPRNLGIKFFAVENTSDSLINSHYEKAANSIELYNSSFAKSKPLKDMTIVFRQTKKLNYLYCRSNVIVSISNADSYGSLAHELSHHWWDKANFLTEAWLNESFAQYSMLLVYEKYKPSIYEKRIIKFEEDSKKLPPISKTGAFSSQSNEVIYTKGVHILKTLEAKIGKEKMIELMSNRIKKSINTTEGLLNELETLTDSKTKNYLKNLLDK